MRKPRKEKLRQTLNPPSSFRPAVQTIIRPGAGGGPPEPSNVITDFERDAANFGQDGTTSPQAIIRALEPIEKATGETASTDRLNVYPGGTAALPAPIAGQSFEFAIKARGGDVVTPLGTVPDGFIQHFLSLNGAPVEGAPLLEAQTGPWPLWGNADGVLTESQHRLLPEVITLPDSASGAPPADGDALLIATQGQTWGEWADAGGRFETEGNGPTSLPDQLVDGSGNDAIWLIYEAASNGALPADRWDFKAGGGTTQTPAQIVAAVDANLGGTDWRTDPTLPAPTNYATAGTSVPEHIAGIDVALAPKSSNQIPVDFTGTNVMPQYPNVEEWLKALDESVSTLRGEIAAASGVIDTSTTSALLLTPSTPAATYNYELTLKSMEGSPVVTFSGPQGAAIDTVNDPRGVLTLAMLTGNAESVTIDGIASRLWGTIGIKINGASLGDIVFRDYAVGLGTFADAADDPEKAFRGALTSTGPGEDDGLGAFTQMSAPNQLFDPVKGMNPNDNRAVRALLSDPIRDKLFEQFTVGLEVETSYLDYETTRTKNTYLLSKTNGWTGVRADSTTDTRLDNLGGPLLVRGHFSPLDKGEFSDIRVTGDATHFEMYVDDLQVQRNVRERDVVTSYGTWYVGGLTTASTATMDGFHIRNAFGLTRVAGLDASRLESVGLLGDSFIAGSLLPDWAIDPDNDLHWYPGPGYAANGSPQGAATVAHYASATSRAHGDAGLVCQVFRYLSKNRYWPCGNANRSKSGDRITQAPAQFALMQGTDGVTPEAVVMQFGANDAAAPRAVADFDADYKAMLSTLDAAGVKYATVNQVITLSNDGAYGAANNTAVDEYNAAIVGFPAWAAAQGLSIRIGIVDLFADFGGHTPIADMFLAGDIHPSAKGSSHMGRKMGERLSALISTGL